MATQAPFSRRALLKGLGWAGLAGSAAVAQRWLPSVARVNAQTGGQGRDHTSTHGDTIDHMNNMVVGDVDHAANGFDPRALLTDFDYGTVSTLPDGRTLREFQLVAGDQLIEIAPGVTYPAWTYNGRVPGPTLRCTEGDLLRVTFINGGSHPHSVHFHGMHPAAMDGAVPIAPGDRFVYEFDAEPFGLHLYHCHVVPLRRHLHKGLYGAFIIDPPTPRPPAQELVMVMNGFDTNFDNENEVYAVNTIPFVYAKHPIPLALNELVRVYLVNATEFDPINSFHVHGNFFDVYRTGTRLEPQEFTDMIMLAQAERHILEFRFKFPGQYMFHAHQTEFTELGWMGTFDVQERSAGGVTAAQTALFGVCDLPSQPEVRNG